MSGSQVTPFRKAIALAFAFVVLAYGGWSFRHVFNGPEIILETPYDGESVPGKVALKGFARDAVETSIDGRTLYVDGQGRFEEEIVLPKGPAIITLYAKDRFGREATREVRLYAQ
jgi:hypothetical protein